MFSLAVSHRDAAMIQVCRVVRCGSMPRTRLSDVAAVSGLRFHFKLCWTCMPSLGKTCQCPHWQCRTPQAGRRNDLPRCPAAAVSSTVCSPRASRCLQSQCSDRTQISFQVMLEILQFSSGEVRKHAMRSFATGTVPGENKYY